MIDPRDVVAAYRILLDREPESDEIVRQFAQLANPALLRRVIMSSPEYVGSTFPKDVPAIPLVNFLHIHTIRMTARRQEHLASLGLNLYDRTVLEVGAGIGLHTTFFLDRGCRVLATDGRPENVTTMRALYDGYAWYDKHPQVEFMELDIEADGAWPIAPREIVYCYGVLYHCARPDLVIANLARVCTALLLIETGVSIGDYGDLHLGYEDPRDVSQSINASGSHPNRQWIFSELRKHFEFVYYPKTQPRHEYFPINWRHPRIYPGQTLRATFVASRRQLNNATLATEILHRQEYAP